MSLWDDVSVWSEILRWTDLFSCWVIFVISGLLLFANDVRTKRQAMLALGLMAGVIGCFVGAVVIWETGHRTPWAVSQRFGHAALLVWVWDKKFGFADQAKRVCAWVTSFPARVREAYSRWRWS